MGADGSFDVRKKDIGSPLNTSLPGYVLAAWIAPSSLLLSAAALLAVAALVEIAAGRGGRPWYRPVEHRAPADGRTE